MTLLEEQLRDVLQERAGWARLSDDVAGNAIRGAVAVRRRRAFTATGVAVLAVVVAVSGVVLTRPSAAPIGPGHPTSRATSIPPTPTQSTVDKYGIHLDVLETGNVLRTTDGHTFALGAGGIQVMRVPAGWLYGVAGQDLSLLTTSGHTIELALTAVDAGVGLERPGIAVVSADGQHIAWVGQGRLHAADLTVDGVTNVVSSPAPTDAFVPTWIGARVVVAQPTGTGCCGYDPDRFDVWDPAGGDFVPTWTTGPAFIYGPVPTGAPALANVQGPASGMGCLARVNGVENLSTLDTACPDEVAFESTMHLLSPDGAHLLELDFMDQGHLVIVDTRTLKVTGECGGDEPIAFENSTDALVWNSITQQMVRCDVATGTTSLLSGTPLDPSNHAIVPRYGV